MTGTFLPPACSGMTLTSQSGRHYWFRTCDIDTDIWTEGAHVVSFPAGAGIPFGKRKEEKGNYALIGITNNSSNTWILDGVNEKGLVGGLLFLYEGTSVDKADDGCEGYVGMELVTKFLSVCGDVEEVKELAQTLQVLNIPYEGEKVQATMHYFFIDATGNEVILEATDRQRPGRFTIYQKDEMIGVMTNSPIYPKQISNLAWYLSKAPELLNGPGGEKINSLLIGNRKIKGDENAEHLLRSDTFPASYCSYDRFVRLAVLKALNENGRNFPDDNMLASGSGIMSSVYEPYSGGVYHYTGFDPEGRPIGQKDGCTRYLVMYDVAQRKLYLRASDAVTFAAYSLAYCDKVQVREYPVLHDGMAGILKGN